MTNEMADTRIAAMVAMLEQARRSYDPLVRAQILAETQYQAAWALREAVVDCQEADRSWAEIGGAVFLSRETAWRQFKAGGPLVAVKPYQSADSPLADTQLGPRTADSAIYAFRDSSQNWFGPYDQLREGEFRAGWLNFDPPNAPGSRFSRQELLVRYGPWENEASFHAPLVRDVDSDSPMRIRATYEVIDWLFGDGQTALRQAMTAVAQAAAITPRVEPKLADLIDRAATAQGPDVPTEEFVAAVKRVADDAVHGYRTGLRFSQALQRLERAVEQYHAWAERTDP